MSPHTLPETVQKYAESPLFTEESVPAKLTSEHNTKPGVWGKICLTSGEVLYVIPGKPAFEKYLSPGIEGIIAPEEMHYVLPKGPVEFKVEFYREVS